MSAAGQHGALPALDFSCKEKPSEEIWIAVQSLLIYDVIQEKESTRFSKTCVISVIRVIIPVLSPGQKGLHRVQLRSLRYEVIYLIRMVTWLNINYSNRILFITKNKFSAEFSH